MGSFSDASTADVERQIKGQFDQTIGNTDGLTEVRRFANHRDPYRKEAGVELSDADVRASLLEQMGGCETT
jgi:hypothetical protein